MAGGFVEFCESFNYLSMFLVVDELSQTMWFKWKGYSLEY